MQVKKVDRDRTSYFKIYFAICSLRGLHFQVESLHKDGGAGSGEVEKELKDIERKMSDLVKDREDRSKRIMDRRVLQVTTLQELGKFEAICICSRYIGSTEYFDIVFGCLS